MDVRGKVEELATKLKADPQLLARFQKEPVATLEKLLGVDLPDETIEKVADGRQGQAGRGETGERAGRPVREEVSPGELPESAANTIRERAFARSLVLRVWLVPSGRNSAISSKPQSRILQSWSRV